MSGYLFLVIYIILLGIGTFLQKFVMKTLSPFQLEFLIAIGMFLVSVPALLFTQKSLHIPAAGIPMGLLVGLLFSGGSLAFTLGLSKMNVGLASAISVSYIVLALILSVIFLKEPLNLMKIAGITLTLIGVGLLFYQQS
jgi:drug/metabolite transporter (DMT)-like permease